MIKKYFDGYKKIMWQNFFFITIGILEVQDYNA